MNPKRLRAIAVLLMVGLILWLAWAPRAVMVELRALHAALRPPTDALIARDKAPGSEGTKESFTYVFRTVRSCQDMVTDYGSRLQMSGFAGAAPIVNEQGRREFGWEKSRQYCASLTCPTPEESDGAFVFYLRWQRIRFPGACP